MAVRETLEDDISALNKCFTRRHDMTGEEGSAVVRVLLKEVEQTITERGKQEGAKMEEELKTTNHAVDGLETNDPEGQQGILTFSCSSNVSNMSCGFLPRVQNPI